MTSYNDAHFQRNEIKMLVELVNRLIFYFESMQVNSCREELQLFSVCFICPFICRRSCMLLPSSKQRNSLCREWIAFKTKAVGRGFRLSDFLMPSRAFVIREPNDLPRKIAPNLLQTPILAQALWMKNVADAEWKECWNLTAKKLLGVFYPRVCKLINSLIFVPERMQARRESYFRSEGLQISATEG